VLAARVAAELRTRVDRAVEPHRAGTFDTETVLRKLDARNVTELWERLAENRYPFVDDHAGADRIAALLPGESDRVLEAAAWAVERRVGLLGSGPVALGTPVDWQRDPKTGRVWPLTYGRAIDYVNLDEPSDVKLPWEISRVQWLLPAGQAYLLTGDDGYAQAVRDVLTEWSAANPYPLGVNWAIAMEPALRILSWTWLFRACRDSRAFADGGFRETFIRQLYLHGRFVARNIERSDVNGNHYTADAAGLVFAGLFFVDGGEPRRWAREGWEILLAELPRQVYADGVDFEASIPYHRLVAELFLLPALYRESLGLGVPAWYRERVTAMARFGNVVTRADGTTPVLGDNDDARALPLGGQGRRDHRYLAGILDMRDEFSGPRSEVAWVRGADDAGELPARDELALPSAAFTSSGIYVMRGKSSDVVVDCGPVGLHGRGGHGHNDCLSFDAWLDGRPVIVDSGCYVYTASVEWRNRLRATAAHNTPQIDGAEQATLDPNLLWTLGAEAVPEIRTWQPSATHDLLVAAHAGYQRLASPVTPVRAVALEHESGMLAVHDRFEGAGSHDVRVPFHLAPGLEPVEARSGTWLLRGEGDPLALIFGDANEWEAVVEDSWFAPSYGTLLGARCLVLRRTGPLQPLLVAVGTAPDLTHAAALVT
jgi:uncharacterized heparinase superfamily protein